MRAPCLLGVVASRGTGPWGTPQVFYAGEYDSSSISENHFRDNRCLEKVRCLGMFSHTIVENAKRRRVGKTGTGRQNGREAHALMGIGCVGIADLQGILGMLRLKSLLFGVVSVRM
jgi:hypothetical protein